MNSIGLIQFAVWAMRMHLFRRLNTNRFFSVSKILSTATAIRSLTWHYRRYAVIPGKNSTQEKTSAAPDNITRTMATSSEQSSSCKDSPKLQTLSREQFKQEIPVKAVKLPVKKLADAVKKLKDYKLCLPKVKYVVEDPSGDSQHKLLLLSRDVSSDNLEELPEDSRTWLFDEAEGKVADYRLTLGYEHLTATEVLEKILPPSVTVPSSFETVGHIAHFNLNEEQAEYKEIIGQVVLDKNPHIKTVVNKTEEIQNQFRTFPMEVIAGEPNLHVKIKEGGANFEFDYSKVYWNSRLSTEHHRLVEEIIKTSGKPGTERPATDLIVADMFCGVGPFAIPLAQKGSYILANDLNPESTKALQRSLEINKIKGQVEVSTLDAREFIKDAIYSRETFVHHIIMNLPADALSFCGMLQCNLPV